MKTFAIYKKSKRAKDLHRVAWPIYANNAADALASYVEQRRAAGDPVKPLRWRERLRVMECDANVHSGMAGPPTTISHYTRGRTPDGTFRSL